MLKKRKITYQVKNTQEKEIWPLEEIKNYLRVSHDYDNKLIISLRKSAISHAENFTGLSLYQRDIVCNIQNVPESIIPKYSPIMDIKNVYLLRANEKTEITNNFGYIATDTQFLHFSRDYIGYSISIEYIAGYKDEISRTIQHGILMHIASMYEHAEDGINMSAQIRDLYIPYRIMRI